MCFCSSLTEDKARIAFIDLKAGLPILRVAWKALAEIIASASRTKVNFMDGDVLVVGRGGVQYRRKGFVFFVFFKAQPWNVQSPTTSQSSGRYAINVTDMIYSIKLECIQGDEYVHYVPRSLKV